MGDECRDRWARGVSPNPPTRAGNAADTEPTQRGSETIAPGRATRS
jgi:hypothetical protein